MGDFGEKLRREREMRGITLQEISETTKINVRFLEALETEDFSKLPGGIFTRSFVRAYANYLGLDQEQVMAEWQLAAPHKDEEDFSRIGVNHNAKKKAGIPILPWVVAIILLGGGYFTFRYAHRASEESLSFSSPVAAGAATASEGSPATSQPVTSPTPVIPSPAAASSSTLAEPAANAGGAAAQPQMGEDATGLPSSEVRMASASTAAVGASPSPAGAAPSSTAPPNPLTPTQNQNGAAMAAPVMPGELVLQVAATQRSWVAVNADGKTVFEHTLNPSEVRTLVAKNFFDVTTGNALGTVLTLNGVTLKPLGRYGEVKTIHLTQNDLKNSTP